MSTLKILGLSGSLRGASTNTALLRTAAALAPDGVELLIHDYRRVPLYDADLAEVPGPVAELKAAIAAADGVLLAVPEYNYSLPGVLKNALDWASRPAYRSPFAGKPVGVVSAAASFVGGARGQQHAKTILLGMGAALYAAPELLVGRAHEQLVDGQLVDDTTRGLVAGYVEGFVAWTRRLAA